MSLMFNGGNRARQHQQRNAIVSHKQPTPTNKELARLERVSEQRHSKPAEPLFSQFSFSIFTKRKAPDPQKSVDKSDPIINPTTQRLVIHDYKDQIVKAVKNSPITIIVAPTGCGKSTYVPQFLAAEGHKVVVLQPRRLPSSKLAEYGAMLDGSELGEKVGFRHSLARLFSRKTEIIYATEGYELTKALATGEIDPKTTYIFDEFQK
jgi:HrpA-like RNA helicase